MLEQIKSALQSDQPLHKYYLKNNSDFYERQIEQLDLQLLNQSGNFSGSSDKNLEENQNQQLIVKQEIYNLKQQQQQQQQQNYSIGSFDPEYIEKEVLQLDMGDDVGQSQKLEDQSIVQNLIKVPEIGQLCDKKMVKISMALNLLKENMSKYEEQLQQIQTIKQNKTNGDENKPFDMNSEQLENLLLQMNNGFGFEYLMEKNLEKLKQQVKLEKKQIKKKIRIFKCQEKECSFQSTKKRDVSRHVRACHNYFGIECEFRCQYCQQMFHIEEARTLHEKTHHQKGNQLEQQKQEPQQQKGIQEEKVVQAEQYNNGIQQISYSQLEIQQECLKIPVFQNVQEELGSSAQQDLFFGDTQVSQEICHLNNEIVLDSE